jgi:hypothetical protein
MTIGPRRLTRAGVSLCDTTIPSPMQSMLMREMSTPRGYPSIEIQIAEWTFRAAFEALSKSSRLIHQLDISTVNTEQLGGDAITQPRQS